MAPMEYLGAWGTLIHEKNLKSKISCQTPFKNIKIKIRHIYIQKRSEQFCFENMCVCFIYVKCSEV
jgi:hypothetical protein